MPFGIVYLVHQPRIDIHSFGRVPSTELPTPYNSHLWQNLYKCSISSDDHVAVLEHTYTIRNDIYVGYDYVEQSL
jgi:hypothetical protein